MWIESRNNLVETKCRSNFLIKIISTQEWKNPKKKNYTDPRNQLDENKSLYNRVQWRIL